MSKSTHVAAVLFSCWAALSAGHANAQAATSNQMPARVKVDPSCTVQAGPMNFGNSFIINFGNLDATSTILVRCGPGVPFTVSLDAGEHNNGNRRMHNAIYDRYLTYQVYRNAARTQVWGSTPATLVNSNSGMSGSVILTAYGRVPNPILVFPGAYTDTLTVTVNF